MDGLEIFGVAVSGSAAGGLAAYYAAKEAINVMLARLDERVNSLRKDLDSDHAKLESVRQDFYSSRGARE